MTCKCGCDERADQMRLARRAASDAFALMLMLRHHAHQSNLRNRAVEPELRLGISDDLGTLQRPLQRPAEPDATGNGLA